MSLIDNRYAINEFARAIGSIEHTTDERRIRVKSRDRYAVSPLLKEMLEGKRADIVVTPASVEELRVVVAAAARLRVPVTLRGAGSANYGQSVPLKGGIVLDMTRIAGVIDIRPGVVRVYGGTVVARIEEALRLEGVELRFIPTTARVATIAGHFAGGQGGPGSVTYGTWRDRGNVVSATVMTMEEEPRLLTLRGREAQRVFHTYGATGIITEMELPTAPAWPWREAIVAFPTYMDAVRFGIELANSPGILKKLASVHDWPTPRLVRDFEDLVPEGHAIVMTMIAEPSFEAFEQFVDETPGRIVCDAKEGEGPYDGSITNYAFGHMLHQIQKQHPDRAVIEGFFRADDLVGLVERVHSRVKRYGPMRFEITCMSGHLVGSGSPYFVYEGPEQMAQMVREMQEAGAIVANSHASNVRAVGKKEIRGEDVAFKREVDPHGLMNPGRFEVDEAADAVGEVTLPTDSWDARLA